MAQEAATENDVKVPNKSMPWSALTNAGREAVTDFTSTFLNGKHAHKSNKQGVLSARAASMLESERDSSKKWIPIVEMQYRGGQYKGRCQGGLPEGKGRLVLGDGSIYDGTWRYGKRSGPGTLYFIHGDVFQGSWRDDLMHGKGWCFFFTQGIGGLQTFGRERQMVKAVSTQRMGMPSLAILKMDSDTGNLYVWMLKEQGTLRFGNMVLL